MGISDSRRISGRLGSTIVGILGRRLKLLRRLGKLALFQMVVEVQAKVLFFGLWLDSLVSELTGP